MVAWLSKQVHQKNICVGINPKKLMRQIHELLTLDNQ
jgi:hypothetical protein